jgi:hypothetical protein
MRHPKRDEKDARALFEDHLDMVFEAASIVTQTVGDHPNVGVFKGAVREVNDISRTVGGTTLPIKEEEVDPFGALMRELRLRVCRLAKITDVFKAQILEVDVQRILQSQFNFFEDVLLDLGAVYRPWESGEMAGKQKTHQCSLCSHAPFRTERGLQTHVRKEHPKPAKVGRTTIKAAVYELFETHGVENVTVEMATDAARAVKPDTRFNKHHLYFWRKKWRDAQKEAEAERAAARPARKKRAKKKTATK